MQPDILFGVAHSLNHNNTQFVKGLFEVDGEFFFFTPEDFRSCERQGYKAGWPNEGDIIAFRVLIDGDFRVFDELPGITQSRIIEILSVMDKPPFTLPKNLLAAKHSDIALIEAVKNTDLAKVQELLDADTDPNSATENGTPALCYAVDKRTEEKEAIAKLLLSFGANPHLENAGGVSPFYVAERGAKDFLPLFKRAEEYFLFLALLKNLRG